VYDVRNLRLIFYDNPFWGRYRGWFRRILSEPRYTDLHANLRHFAERYHAASGNLRNMTGGGVDRVAFRDRYEFYVASQLGKVAQWQSVLASSTVDANAVPARSVA
jgi:hypothetical protein